MLGTLKPATGIAFAEAAAIAIGFKNPHHARYAGLNRRAAGISG
jgi:hypothetical protein